MPHVARDDGVEDELGEVLAQVALDVARQPRAAVVHGQQHARDREPGVELALDHADGLDQAGEALERVVLGLDRHDQPVGRDERVDRQRAERRRAVEQREAYSSRTGASASRRRARTRPARQLDVGAREVGGRRDQVEALDAVGARRLGRGASPASTS